MANQADKLPVTPPQPHAPVAALLSYLVPGLGQITQGRVGKGFLFMVCIYALFFYGLFLGRGTVSIANAGEVKTYKVSGNVYLPTAADRKQDNIPQSNPYSLPQVVLDLYNRPQFIGQFWMGVVVWPAIVQYATYDRNKVHPVLGNFMRTPSNEDLNAVHTSGSKLFELGWVYTVIAGVLNIMVIYDALAGPAHPSRPDKEPTPKAITDMLIPAHNTYLIDLPLLIVVISLVYSATRFDEWGLIWREAVSWGLRLTAFLGTIGIVLYFVAVSPIVAFLLVGFLAILFVGFFFFSKR